MPFHVYRRLRPGTVGATSIFCEALFAMTGKRTTSHPTPALQVRPIFPQLVIFLLNVRGPSEQIA